MSFITYIVGFGITLCTLRAFYNTYLVLSGKSALYHGYDMDGDGEKDDLDTTPKEPTPTTPDIEQYT